MFLDVRENRGSIFCFAPSKSPRKNLSSPSIISRITLSRIGVDKKTGVT
jgi:hypothetical protein